MTKEKIQTDLSIFKNRAIKLYRFFSDENNDECKRLRAFYLFIRLIGIIGRYYADMYDNSYYPIEGTIHGAENGIILKSGEKIIFEK